MLNLTGKQRIPVWQGSYIVNTNGCIDCHTYPSYSPGGNPFLGQPERIITEQYLSRGRQFGPFTTPNITRDEFVQTLRTGHNPHDPAGQILQVMP